MSVKTARKYERGGQLPSQLKQPRTWRTRPNPFEEDWAWVVEQLGRDSALQGPEREVIFEQVHVPAERAQSDAHPHE